MVAHVRTNQFWYTVTVLTCAMPLPLDQSASKQYCPMTTACVRTVNTMLGVVLWKCKNSKSKQQGCDHGPEGVGHVTNHQTEAVKANRTQNKHSNVQLVDKKQHGAANNPNILQWNYVTATMHRTGKLTNIYRAHQKIWAQFKVLHLSQFLNWEEIDTIVLCTYSTVKLY